MWKLQCFLLYLLCVSCLCFTNWCRHGSLTFWLFSSVLVVLRYELPLNQSKIWYFCICEGKKSITYYIYVGKRSQQFNVYDIAAWVHFIKILCFHNQIQILSFLLLPIFHVIRCQVIANHIFSCMCRACKHAWLLFCPGVVYHLKWMLLIIFGLSIHLSRLPYFIF